MFSLIDLLITENIEEQSQFSMQIISYLKLLGFVYILSYRLILSYNNLPETRKKIFKSSKQSFIQEIKSFSNLFMSSN